MAEATAVMQEKTGYESELKAHIDKEKAAVSLISSVGMLMYGRSVELVLFRNHLVDKTVSEVLQLHEYGKKVVKKPISVIDSADLAMELLGMDIAPSKLDIGLLTRQWVKEGEAYTSKKEFLIAKLTDFIGNRWEQQPKDVVLYGFGRIGRLCARELVKQFGKGQQLRLRAIVTRNAGTKEIEKRAALLRNDSVHGHFLGSVEVDAERSALIINGQLVHMIEAKNPEDVDYTAFGIEDALVIDNTGVFNNQEALGRHLQAKGTQKVLLTAPGAGIPNIVYGINHREDDVESTDIWSAASCTTNAISPILKVIEDTLVVEKGHIETVHAYTNDQNLLDNMHKKPRRGRSAAINMVITSTGAGKAVTKVIPSLENKLTANAVRVPTPNGSLAILNLTVGEETTLDVVNGLIKDAALSGDLVNQINYAVDPELVSNDIIGNSCCAVFDSKATIVSNDGKNVVLYVWYDNEFGYTKQVLRLAKHVAQVRRLIYY